MIRNIWTLNVPFIWHRAENCLYMYSLCVCVCHRTNANSWQLYIELNVTVWLHFQCYVLYERNFALLIQVFDSRFVCLIYELKSVFCFRDWMVCHEVCICQIATWWATCGIFNVLFFPKCFPKLQHMLWTLDIFHKQKMARASFRCIQFMNLSVFLK